MFSEKAKGIANVSPGTQEEAGLCLVSRTILLGKFLCSTNFNQEGKRTKSSTLLIARMCAKFNSQHHMFSEHWECNPKGPLKRSYMALEVTSTTRTKLGALALWCPGNILSLDSCTQWDPLASFLSTAWEHPPKIEKNFKENTEVFCRHLWGEWSDQLFVLSSG